MFPRACFALVLVAAGSGEPLDRFLDHIAATRRFQEIAISPDGATIAWVEPLRGTGNTPTGDSAIYVLRWKQPGATPRRITAGNGHAACQEHAPTWSPDGARIAFLSSCAEESAQLYAAPAFGGAARKLTNLTGALADPQWPPDGQALAFLFTAGATRTLGPLEAIGPRRGEIEEQFVNQRLALVAANSGGVRQVSPPDRHVYEYDWSPNGRAFALTAAPGPGDDNWYVAQLFVLNRESGQMRVVYRPAQQIAAPRWSPDGKMVALIGGLMSDEGFTGGDIYTVDLSSGEARNRTERRPASPSWVAWLSPRQLLFTEHLDGGSALARLDLKSGRSETLWSGDEPLAAGGNIGNFALARDGRTCAAIRQSWAQPPEIWAGEPGTWRQLTHANGNCRSAWGRAEKLHWASDGFRVQGWLLYPDRFAPGRRYPLIVDVHGGPAGLRKPSWPRASYDGSIFASQGYFVLFPNPRGSYGQGEAFTRANVKDFGGGDLRDILAGVDEVLKTAPVDPNRIGVTGWSYGGYMTMFAVTQTHRFRAAVAGAGIANWQSYYGQNSIDQWMIPYFGASVYDDPQVYARASPITFIKKVRTPTLVVVGERDGECPPPQSFEFWHALKTLGVKTRLVVYPGEGHAFRSPEHHRDLLRRAIAWFGENLMESSAQ